MRQRIDLRNEQEEAIAFLYARDEGLLLGTVGAGKSVIALTVIRDLIAEGAAKGFLVLAPLKVCQLVWEQEAEKWEHLSGKLKIVNLAGNSPKERARLLAYPADIYLANYELLPVVVRELSHGFDFC